MQEDIVSIIVTPDLCPIKRVDELCEANNFQGIYNDYLSVLENADYRIVNFEAPITGILDPIKKRGPNLFVSPKHVEHLKFANFNLLTLANNHIMDQGDIGFKETIKTLDKNNLEYVGAGNNLESAKKIFYTNINSLKIAILNFTENEFTIASDNKPGANPLDIIDNYNNINEAKINADYVIVIVHGGHEEYNLPSIRMQKTYRFFIDGGADAVIGHHTHCFSGYEIYNNKPIFYGLGNFIFDRENNENKPWNFGFSVKLLLKKTEKSLSFEIHPYRQCNGSEIGVYKLSLSDEIKFHEQIKQLNQIITNPSELSLKWDSLVSRRKKGYINYIEPFDNIFVKVLRKLNLMPKFYSKNKKRILLNLVRCESHRDLLIDILKK